ncbi:metallophosphoesterase [Vibrio owensii]|uniref:metallophosphoesterase n=1 Tax=Vibrio owensii TaxID=696485 RepID=UPI0018F144F8|nr:metallophosphoesterase [Vibrio owensii]
MRYSVEHYNLEHLERLLSFGDIHGEYDLLMFAYEQLKRRPCDAVITCGDTIDRGPKSFQTALHFCVAENTLATLGNHEDMLLKGALDFNRVSAIDHLYNGGEWITDYHEDELSHLCKLIEEKFHLVIKATFAGRRFTFSHADIPNNNPNRIPPAEIHDILWNHKAHRDLFIAKRADLVVHGHKVFKQPRITGNRIFIDTGAGFINSSLEDEPTTGLTCMEVTKRNVYLHRFVKLLNGKLEHYVTPDTDETLCNLRLLLNYA